MLSNIETTINSIAEKLIKNYSPNTIILFGSYLEGKFDEHSDIDLLIVKDTNERFIERWKSVRKILSDPNRKIPIETIIVTPLELKNRLSIGDQFFKNIITKGKILYEA